MTKKSLIESYKAEVENIDETIKILKTKGKKAQRKYNPLELAGFGVYIHNFYNGLENILKRVLLARGIKIKEGPFWHKELLLTALKHRIIDSELYYMLLNYLTFRHYFVHGYAFRLEIEKLYYLVENIEVVYKKFKELIEMAILTK